MPCFCRQVTLYMKPAQDVQRHDLNVGGLTIDSKDFKGTTGHWFRPGGTTFDHQMLLLIFGLPSLSVS